MNLKYDGLYSPSNLVTFTDVPNLLSIEENVSGNKARVVFTFTSSMSTTADSQYNITVLCETVTSVMSPSSAKNRRFYMGLDNSSSAASLAMALRNCSSLLADFQIIHSGTSVVMEARTIGSKWEPQSPWLTTNLPSGIISISTTNGDSFSDLWNSKVMVDVYDGVSYVTSLEKSFYLDGCSFDVSPVLTTFTEYGKVKPYTLKVSSIGSDGKWSSLGSVSGHTSYGYMANQSSNYMYMQGARMLLNNMLSDGEITMYMYEPVIDFSILVGNSVSTVPIRVSVKDSAMDELYNNTFVVSTSSYPNNLIDLQWAIPDPYREDASQVTLGVGTGTYTWNVIKPLRAADGARRVYWRNEYGGISFFDFTGEREENDTLDIETYEKNVFDMYDVEEMERKKVYRNEVTKKVSVSSHLMSEEGKWVFNSLERSKLMWTYVNGLLHYIVPVSVEVTEDGTYDNIYKAKFTYEYSALS